MAIVAGDFVQVLHEGSNDITDYVVSYRRYSSLCEMGDTFEMVFSPDLDVTLSPYDDIRITEWYDGDSGVILRGYVLIINQDYSGAYVVQGQDRSVLLFDYFIPTQIKSQGESVDYWIQYYADQAGLEITFEVSSANAIVAPDTLMGMQTAGEGILTMERLAAYYVRFDSTANKLVAYRLGSSQPVITIDDVVEGRRLKGTEKTRNVVKVYGGYRFSLIPGEPTTLLTSQARTEMPELLVDKTVVVASPGLQKQLYLDIVADRILNTVNSIDDIHFYSLPAFVPNIDVGEIAHLSVNHPPHISYAGERKISSIEASFDQSGAITTIGVGEKCPRISIQFPVPPVYATTTTDGVAASFDGGDSFRISNTGLTGPALGGLNIAANGYGRQMVLTGSGLYNEVYRRFSSLDTWVSPPSFPSDPTNAAGDSPVPTVSGVSPVTLSRVVDEPTNLNTFHIGATWQNDGGDYRTWVYTTTDFGSTWGSNPITTSGAEEGVNYDFQLLDIKAPLTNNVYVLGNVSVTDIASMYWANLTSGGPGYWGAGDWSQIPPASGIATATGDFPATESGDGNGIYTWSCPNNRSVAYVVNVERDGGMTAIQVQRTSDKGATWSQIYNDTISPFSVGSLRVGVVFDIGSLGATSTGVARLAIVRTTVTNDFSPGFPGSTSTFLGHAHIITDNFSGAAVGETVDDVTGHVLETREDVFGDFAWRIESHLIPNSTATTYNPSSDNKGTFGVITYTDLQDFGQSDPDYDPLYENLHLLFFNVNFQAGTVTPSSDYDIGEPLAGWFYSGGGKSPNENLRGQVTTRDSSNIYSNIQEVGEVSRVFKNGSVIRNGASSPSYYLTPSNTATIGTTFVSGSYRYLESDGSISAAITPVIAGSVLSPRLYHRNKYYFVERIIAHSKYVHLLSKSSSSDRTVLEVAIPLTHDWPYGSIGGIIDVRDYE